MGGATPITVNTGGTLLLKQSGATASTDRINNASSVTLAGGKLDLGGKSEGAAGTTGLGALTLTITSVIDFGLSSNENNVIQFSGIGTHTATQVLAIVDWNGTSNVGYRPERLLFAGTVSDFKNVYNQADVSFNGLPGLSAVHFSDIYEVTAVPEPATWVAASLFASLAAYSQRRRLAKLLSQFCQG